MVFEFFVSKERTSFGCMDGVNVLMFEYTDSVPLFECTSSGVRVRTFEYMVDGDNSCTLGGVDTGVRTVELELSPGSGWLGGVLALELAS